MCKNTRDNTKRANYLFQLWLLNLLSLLKNFDGLFYKKNQNNKAYSLIFFGRHTCLRLISSLSLASLSSFLGSLSLLNLVVIVDSWVSFSRNSFFRASISLVSFEIEESWNRLIHLSFFNILLVVLDCVLYSDW